ncbi:LysR family transcriptional regulator [Vibrio sp. B1FLJ16]|uniref:LysR family transcriptional regulator n=1 Tax=Vibrio sp. B1FLJ16 TaxID=2751178 RepID=UPI0015F64AE0|nr:LysR family transcriptional regulator [Vibrio sp. B1FLJ16]CAD7807096.1 LysR substrate binding domain [Vibrio sp. B1FLJ16]CAE6904827.1 LysR substrate binding domain [Vibrio sp. B1FLJ16]
MAKQIEPDKILMKMPSLRAVKSFVAAAKYQSFTIAADSLCVTQAAISRQIRELEAELGVKLFDRVGRTVKLTEAGNIFYDSAHLSFVNIAQAAIRIEQHEKQRLDITVCCSPAFSAFWLSSHLSDFYLNNPGINVNVITTNNFLNLEPGIHPDVFISKTSVIRDGYTALPLFYDIVYPVCSPEFINKHSSLKSAEDLPSGYLLNLSPYGRSQLAEHVDWGIWFAEAGIDWLSDEGYLFTSNDYNSLIQMALNGQGVCLGWHHLVHEMIEQGKLVQFGTTEVTLREKCHYFVYDEVKVQNESFSKFKNWLLSTLKQERISII